MTFIEKIVKIMQERGITAYQLEKDTGIRQSTFAKWKNGTQPTLDKVITILNYFQVSADEIFDLNNNHLTENERELLELFQQLPEREQIKFIGKLEDTAEKFKGN